jgi:mono/diheme cytochrome c family protein
MRLARAFAMPLAAACALAACAKPSAGVDAAVHTLRLPDETVVMPQGPGRDRVLSACVACHTPRYLLDQPVLPRKTWQAEVDKMRTAYGAPVADADVPIILEYVFAIRSPP